MKFNVMGHGSPMATYKIHGGKEPGTKELAVGAGPGRSMEVKDAKMAGSQFEGGSKTGGKAKGMKKYAQE